MEDCNESPPQIPISPPPVLFFTTTWLPRHQPTRAAAPFFSSDINWLKNKLLHGCFFCALTHMHKNNPPPQIQNLILFDCAIFGDLWQGEEAVSCSCLKGSMWRARHINHKGTRKERERKDWSVRWVVERLYWQKLPSLLLSCTLQAPATKMELNYYLSTQHRVEGNHITAVLFNENMQVISKNSHKMHPWRCKTVFRQFIVLCINSHDFSCLQMLMKLALNL